MRDTQKPGDLPAWLGLLLLALLMLAVGYVEYALPDPLLVVTP